jgi:hypothetical protein
MRLVSFKPVRKGALRGFAKVELSNGLTIDDCPVCSSGGTTWAAFPAKPIIGQDRRHLELDGKKQYATILAWPSREIRERWSVAVVDLVRARHPEALE